MNTTEWFVLPDGRLRAGWRLLLFVVFVLIAGMLCQWIAAAITGNFHSSAAVLAISSAAFLMSVTAATAFAVRFLDNQPFHSIGFPMERRPLSQVIYGIVIGAVLISVITSAEAAIGAIHFAFTGAAAAQVVTLTCEGAGIFLIAAASEELLFRGYVFQRLMEGVNDRVALALTAFAFGAVHQWNPHVTRLALANTMLAGLLLGIVYLKTRALWMPIALHFSWNWSLALWGLPISGVEIGKMPWEAEVSGGPVWVSGGDYGPEGGVIATVVLVIAVGLLLMRGGIAPPRTLVLRSTEPGTGPDPNNVPTSSPSNHPSLHPLLS